MPHRTEADLHFELYRHLANALAKNPTVEGVTFGEVRAEYNVNGGIADIVVFDARGGAYLVIEAKRPRSGGGYDRNVDPFSPKVIRQAFRYAGDLGAEFFATYNGRLLVLFQTFEAGTPLLQRRSSTYKVRDPEIFARELLSETVNLHAGRTTWDPHHETFITRLGVFHHRLHSDLRGLLPNRLAEDQEFAQHFQVWVKEQGWDEEDVEINLGTFSSQAAYLLMNKLLFYKLLSSELAYAAELPPFPDVEPSELHAALGKLFKDITAKVDFEAVYDHDPIFDTVVFEATTAEEVKDFLDELESYDLDQFDHDVVGQIYERIIPPLERHSLGQYYTPPAIVSLINHLTIRSSHDQILDPACGSGGFLVGAYERIRSLARDEGEELVHEEILERIFGVDINRFPAHLTAINLALRDLSKRTTQVKVLVEDFFHITPLGLELFTEAADIRNAEEPADADRLPSVVDAVVGNPPYIRQEKIRFKKLCRRHLSRVGASLTSRSDIYAYFFTHASEFLRDGGRLGFITSDAWLNVGYGEDLQDFFLDNFRIVSVIVFNRQVFDDPLVVTCVTILERCELESARDDTTVHFLLVREKLSLEEIVALLEEGGEPGRLRDAPTHRSATLRQASLRGQRKWGRFLFGPTLYWEILATEKCIPLNVVSDVNYVGKTGANDYFYFRDAEGVEQAGVERRFVTPLLKHIAETEHISLQEEDLTWYVLDVHEFVSSALAARLHEDHRAAGEIVKEALIAEGHTGLLAYIEHGEAQQLHLRPSIRGRRVWFDLGPLARPPILFSKEFWRKWHVLRNDANVTIDQRLYAVYPRPGWQEFLLGVLNSRFGAIVRELHGRLAAGQAMNRSYMAAYEVATMPVPDPREFSHEAVASVVRAIAALVAEERIADETRIVELRDALDHAVLGLFGLEDRVEELQRAAQGLMRYREQGGADNTEVLVELERQAEKQPQEIRLVGAELVNARTQRSQQGSLFD